MQFLRCNKSYVYEEQFLIINEMDRLLWIIHTTKRFFITVFLWVFAYGLQSMVIKSQLLLYCALCPAPHSQSEYKVAKCLCAHIPGPPTVWDTTGSPSVQTPALWGFWKITITLATQVHKQGCYVILYKEQHEGILSGN